MSELLSVGLDVGTTTTQLIVSKLKAENRASGFAVPQMEITGRQVLYRGPVRFTPLQDEAHVDGTALRRIVEEEYAAAGLRRQDVDTGAIIITGETSRKENASAVLQALSDYAGEFVVATAGPDLESILAAKGSGAAEYSEKTGKTVLHMDIGGGTSNLALIREGKIRETGCLNIGGRLIKLEETGKITYISPVLTGITPLKVGDTVTKEQAQELAAALAEVLEMAAGCREESDRLRRFTTRETGREWTPPRERPVLSFSGGVADCIDRELPWKQYGDLGPLLGQAIRRSALCQQAYVLGRETIRATVIGAGSHSTQLSGSTVYCQNIRFPLKNIPVVHPQSLEQIEMELEKQEGRAVIALEGLAAPSYSQIAQMAEELLRRIPGEILICLEQDMAKALGQALALRCSRDRPILCIDRVRIGEGSYLDIGAPIEHALPVVVKTLVLGKG